MPIEQRGVDTIPEAERTSTPRDLISILLGSNLCLGVIVFGWLPASFGLGLWASVTSIVAGTIVGVAVTAPLALVSLRTATNLSTSSGAAVRRTRPARRLRRRPAALPRVHRADPVDRRGRDGRHPGADRRAADGRRRARPGVRAARRVYRRRRRLRLPAAAPPQQGPRHRHDRAAAARTDRLRPGPHHGRAAGHPVPARLLLADLAARPRSPPASAARSPSSPCSATTRATSRRCRHSPAPGAAGRPGWAWSRVCWSRSSSARTRRSRPVRRSTTRARWSPRPPSGTWSRCSWRPRRARSATPA